ncbi:MAG: flavodoxin-dependent (E)-4-hydroxy-3-methylbut-2-enyl-diphosphate synthase [Ureaplasma sp.]|nr:flavodoxin-dependent (E)-4-hydroxy-3-methylbut-2-enyl-diphosphate synthase [Ureaplasma sp.]
MFNRNQTKQVKFNDIVIGGQNNLVIQSMTNTKTANISATLKQINELKDAGCEVVRIAVFDDEDAKSLAELVKKSNLPLIADIHFNFEYAIIAIKSGIKKIRLNPGNLEDPEKLKLICEYANKYNVVIRIGVNSGSLPKSITNLYDDQAIQMVESAKYYIKLLNSNNFDNIVVSLKSSDPLITLRAYQLASNEFNYPLHLGVTEAGMLEDAIIKSSAGLAPLLIQGIGDTIRISITDDPVKEIYVVRKLLNVLQIRSDMVNIISCPTCGRLNYDMFPIVEEIKKYTKNINKKITISILGCIVNGIGEGKEADIGLAGSYDKVILFKKGQIYKTIPSKNALEELKHLIDEYLKEIN